MIYDIRNKKLDIILENEIITLPIELKEKINKHFKKIKSNGANIWNGEIFCVTKCSINEENIELICKKSDYAHYLYGERIGLSKEYECKNLSAGCLIETLDDFYIIGELDNSTSFPTMLQVTGGNIDKEDIYEKNIDIFKTIIRETKEELNLDLNDKENVLSNEISYIYISEASEQPGIVLFSKVKIKMTANEMKKYFEQYYNYLIENKLEIEFSKLHFIKKENAIDELKRLNNPKRNYLLPLLKLDLVLT